MTHENHDHGHGHAHGHHHEPASYGMAFAVGTGLNILIVAAELGFGYAAGSLALMADGAHNLSDVLGLMIAGAAAWAGKLAPTKQRTYGYGRSSILAALVNAMLLLLATGAIVLEAVRRFANPEPVAADVVILIGVIGIAANGFTALLFARGREHDLNIRGVFLHMAGDAAVSFGVVVAALLIKATGWLWLDPAISLLIAAVVLASTWSLLRDSVNLSMDAIPPGIDRDAVETFLGRLEGVTEVHDLHIWALSTTKTALTVHLVRPGTGLDDVLLARAGETLKAEFGIDHATIQLEAGEGICRLAPHEVV